MNYLQLLSRKDGHAKFVDCSGTCRIFFADDLKLLVSNKKPENIKKGPQNCGTVG